MNGKTSGGIDFHHVSKRFTTMSGSVPAVDDVSFGIQPGEFASVVGPSGCGKTTLLRLVAGLDEPTSGTVSMDGKSVDKPSSDDVGVVFQRAALLPWRNALDNVLLPIEIKRRVNADDRQLAMSTLKKVGLEGFERHYPAQLSGGMQQRVSISRALLTKPKVLLMDEPFGAIDALTREQMNRDLNSIWVESNITAMLITHSIPEAVYLGQKVVVMGAKPGRVLDIINVDLPRSRPLSVLASKEFSEICSRVRKVLES